MANYCSEAEALSLLPTIGTLSGTTTPTTTQAGTIITAVTAEIDMHLRGQGYTTQPTDTEALASVKTIAMNGAAARIAKAKWPTSAGPGGDGGAADLLRRDYQAGLAFIDAGGLAPDAGATAGAVSYDFERSYDVLLSDLNATDNDAPF